MERNTNGRSSATWRDAGATCSAAGGALCRLADLDVDTQAIIGGEWSDQIVLYADGNGGTLTYAHTYDYDNNVGSMVIGVRPVTDTVRYRCCFPRWEH